LKNKLTRAKHIARGAAMLHELNNCNFILRLYNIIAVILTILNCGHYDKLKIERNKKYNIDV